MNSTLELIHRRRSVRNFQKRDLEQSVVEEIVDAAIRSPTAGNMMLYSIIEVEDQAMKDKLVVTCDNQPFIAKAPLVLLFVADYQRWFDFFQASDVDGYCTEKNIPLRLPGEGDLMLACCDALIAAQTAVIAAESLGVGSCYIGDIMENFEEHQELFSLPRYTFPVTMLCFGYPTESAARRSLTYRFKREHILKKNRYTSLQTDELKDAYSHLEPRTFIEDTSNSGQHYYVRKFASDYSVEMTRSVRRAILSWVDG